MKALATLINNCPCYRICSLKCPRRRRWNFCLDFPRLLRNDSRRAASPGLHVDHWDGQGNHSQNQGKS